MTGSVTAPEGIHYIEVSTRTSFTVMTCQLYLKQKQQQTVIKQIAWVVLNFKVILVTRKQFPNSQSCRNGKSRPTKPIQQAPNRTTLIHKC